MVSSKCAPLDTHHYLDGLSQAWTSEQQEYLKTVLKDRRKTNKFIKTEKLSTLDEKVRSFANRSYGLDRTSDQQRKAENKQLSGHDEFFEEIDNDEATSDNYPPSNINIEIDHEMLSHSFVPSHYSQRSEKKEEQARRQQKTASVVVTSGALTFVLLAAVLVTISFLMSPVIEQIFGTY